LIGSASARVVVEQHRARAEALSIRRLEGRRWQGGRLWSHKLSASESNIILGAAIQYEIAEVVDPMHIVAKIRKSLLASLK
jgi:hypothetical protein